MGSNSQLNLSSLFHDRERSESPLVNMQDIVISEFKFQSCSYVNNLILSLTPWNVKTVLEQVMIYNGLISISVILIL